MYTVGSTCASGAAAAASRGMCRTAIPNLISQYLQVEQHSPQWCLAAFAPTLLELKGDRAVTTLLNSSDQLQHAKSHKQERQVTALPRAGNACCATQ